MNPSFCVRLCNSGEFASVVVYASGKKVLRIGQKTTGGSETTIIKKVRNALKALSECSKDSLSPLSNTVV